MDRTTKADVLLLRKLTGCLNPGPVSSEPRQADGLLTRKYDAKPLLYRLVMAHTADLPDGRLYRLTSSDGSFYSIISKAQIITLLVMQTVENKA